MSVNPEFDRVIEEVYQSWKGLGSPKESRDALQRVFDEKVKSLIPGWKEPPHNWSIKQRVEKAVRDLEDAKVAAAAGPILPARKQGQLARGALLGQEESRVEKAGRSRAESVVDEESLDRDLGSVTLAAAREVTVAVGRTNVIIDLLFRIGRWFAQLWAPAPLTFRLEEADQLSAFQALKQASEIKYQAAVAAVDGAERALRRSLESKCVIYAGAEERLSLEFPERAQLAALKKLRKELVEKKKESVEGDLSNARAKLESLSAFFDKYTAQAAGIATEGPTSAVEEKLSKYVARLEAQKSELLTQAQSDVKYYREEGLSETTWYAILENTSKEIASCKTYKKLQDLRDRCIGCCDHLDDIRVVRSRERDLATIQTSLTGLASCLNRVDVLYREKEREAQEILCGKESPEKEASRRIFTLWTDLNRQIRQQGSQDRWSDNKCSAYAAISAEAHKDAERMVRALPAKGQDYATALTAALPDYKASAERAQRNLAAVHTALTEMEPLVERFPEMEPQRAALQEHWTALSAEFAAVVGKSAAVIAEERKALAQKVADLSSDARGLLDDLTKRKEYVDQFTGIVAVHRAGSPEHIRAEAALKMAEDVAKYPTAASLTVAFYGFLSDQVRLMATRDLALIGRASPADLAITNLSSLKKIRASMTEQRDAVKKQIDDWAKAGAIKADSPLYKALRDCQEEMTTVLSTAISGPEDDERFLEASGAVLAENVSLLEVGAAAERAHATGLRLQKGLRSRIETALRMELISKADPLYVRLTALSGRLATLTTVAPEEALNAEAYRMQEKAVEAEYSAHMASLPFLARAKKLEPLATVLSEMYADIGADNYEVTRAQRELVKATSEIKSGRPVNELDEKGLVECSVALMSESEPAVVAVQDHYSRAIRGDERSDRLNELRGSAAALLLGPDREDPAVHVKALTDFLAHIRPIAEENAQRQRVAVAAAVSREEAEIAGGLAEARKKCSTWEGLIGVHLIRIAGTGDSPLKARLQDVQRQLRQLKERAVPSRAALEALSDEINALEGTVNSLLDHVISEHRSIVGSLIALLGEAESGELTRLLESEQAVVEQLLREETPTSAMSPNELETSVRHFVTALDRQYTGRLDSNMDPRVLRDLTRDQHALTQECSRAISAAFGGPVGVPKVTAELAAALVRVVDMFREQSKALAARGTHLRDLLQYSDRMQPVLATVEAYPEGSRLKQLFMDASRNYAAAIERAKSPAISLEDSRRLTAELVTSLDKLQTIARQLNEYERISGHLTEYVNLASGEGVGCGQLTKVASRLQTIMDLLKDGELQTYGKGLGSSLEKGIEEVAKAVQKKSLKGADRDEKARINALHAAFDVGLASSFAPYRKGVPPSSEVVARVLVTLQAFCRDCERKREATV